MIIFLLKIIFCGSALGQLAYWFFVFSKLAFYPQQINNETLKANVAAENVNFSLPLTASSSSVSVVICARNACENLRKNLPDILNQKYANFEVIVVNDASMDETAALLEEFSRTNKNLRIINVAEKKTPGKKGALALGIEAAQCEWLLLTDADCRPLSNLWISGMIKEVDTKEIGLGFAPYEKSDTILNRFIRFETVWTAVQYMGFAIAGEPYMGVGRNIIYKKKIYEKSEGFKKHAHLASGDDDLFINSVISKNNFEIILNPETFMPSEPHSRWNDYFTQKSRHFTTATSYTLKHQIMLGVLSLTHFLLFVTAFLLLALKISTIFVTLIIAVRMFVMLYFYDKILRKFQEQNLLFWMPLLDALYVFFYVIFTPALFLRNKKW